MILNWKQLSRSRAARSLGAIILATGLGLFATGGYAQAPIKVHTASGTGTISTSVSSPTTLKSAAATPIPHTAGGKGTITTSLGSPGPSTQIVGTPVPHRGGGSLTTSTASAASARGAASTAKPAAAAAAVGQTDPAFQVSASCAANSVGLMTITNTGGDMTVAYSWRVSLNGVPIAQNTFQLASGQTFNISTSSLYGTLTLDVLDTTNAVVATGAMVCQAPPPPVPPSFTVTASCAANSVGLMTINNVGGDMTVPYTWRVSLDGTPIAQNTFQLTAGQSFNINTSSLYGTLTLDVLDTTNTVVATGAMVCQAPPPPPPPVFSLTANCAANSVGLMTITDTGGDMPVPYTWRVSLNGAPIAQNTFQLTSGQTFNISTSGLYGTLTLDVLDTTNAVVATASMACQAPPPPVPPSFSISANCAPDSTGLMTITNTGGDMTVPFTWRVSQDGVPIAQNTFQLTAGQSFNINTSSLYGTLTLDVLDATNAIVATGSMVCQAAPPPPPPAFTVGGNCAVRGAGVFTITDVGGDMAVPYTWRIDRKGARKGNPIATSSFQLTAGKALAVKTSKQYGTLTLSVLDPSSVSVASGSIFCKAPDDGSGTRH